MFQISTRWNLLNSAFLLGTPLAAAILLPYTIFHRGVGWGEILTCAAMVFAVGTAISAGYHRLFSHKAFEASRPVKLVCLLFGAASFENSALKWSSDHRLHHRAVDTEFDPYNISRGFWFAHMVWAMRAGDKPIDRVSDLQKDPMVMWQHRNHFLIGALVSAVVPVTLGLLTGNLLGYLVVGVLLRVLINHHTTFLINSAAHVFGTRPYCLENSSRDNGWLAPITYGEGYHNFHHTWAWDYRNGYRWWQYDSTKWILNLLAWFGLVRGLKRVPDAVVKRAELKVEETTLRERLAAAAVPSSFDERLVEARRRLDAALEHGHTLFEAWESKKADARADRALRAEQRRALYAEARAAFARHREELSDAWREWKLARGAARSALAAA